MTAQRDPDAILAAWLDAGPTDLPDATRRAILTALPTTPQARRGPFAPRRFSEMSSLSRLAVLAVLATALIGGAVYVLGSQNQTAPVSSGPPQSVSATSVPTATATDAAGGAEPTPYFGQMTASPLDGRADGFEVPFSYHLPAGVGLVAGQSEYGFYQFRVPVAWDEYGAGIIVRWVDSGRTDPCTDPSALLPLDPGPQAVVDYLKTVPTVEVRDVTPATLDGRPALRVALHVGEATADCQDVWLWDGVGSISQNGGRNTDWLFWIVDVRDGEIVTRPNGSIHVVIFTQGGADWLPTAEEFVQSLRFDSPQPSAAGG